MMSVPESHLHRSLGLGDVVLYFVTACTGLQWVAFAAAAGPSALVIWLFAAVGMFLPLSVCTVALAARHPDEGGLYVWSKIAFGPFAGFLAGWTYWTSNLPYFAGMLYFAAGSILFVRGDAQQASPAWFIGFALFGLGFGTVLNVFGLAVSKWLNNAAALARCMTLLLLIVVAAAATARYGPATAITPASLRPGVGLQNLVFFATLAFAMTGPESASFMGGEISDPRRTVPRALARAAPLILAIYIGGTFAVLLSVPWQETSPMYGVMQAVEHVGARSGMPWLTPLAAVLIVITCLGSAAAWLGAVARIPFVAGLDSFLPKAFGRLHPKYGSPVTALLIQTGITMVFAVLGQAGTTVKGAYEVLVSLMVIASMLPYLLLFTATIRLVWRASATESPRRTGARIGVVAAALLGLATTVCVIALSTVPRADEPHKLLAVGKIIGMTAMMVGLGVLFYANGTRRQRRSPSG